MSVVSGANIVRSGLVFHIDAADIKSYPGTGSTVYDLSGSNNNATLVNTPTYSTNNNGYFVLNGTNNYATFSPTGLPYGASPGTLVGWSLSTSTASGYKWILAYGSPSTNQARFIGVNGTTFYAGGYGNDITYSGLVANTWYQIANVYDGTTAYMYVNGILVASSAKSWNTVSSLARIGQQVNTANEFWVGSISTAQIYNRALTAAEIKQNFEATRGRYNI